MMKATQYCSDEQCGPWALCIGGSFFQFIVQTLEVWYFMLFRLDHFIKVISHHEYFHKLLEKKIY